MKYILLIISCCGLLNAQQLTPQGVTPVSTEVDFSQKEIFDKIQTCATEYLIIENIHLTDQTPGESITLQGEANHRACVINQMMGSKTCFNLIYTLQVSAKDKAFKMEVLSLKAESPQYPEADYTNWFDAEGNPVANLNSLIEGTTEFFRSINNDFKQFIEEGDYW